jgi:hypothetical protein
VQWDKEILPTREIHAVVTTVGNRRVLANHIQMFGNLLKADVILQASIHTEEHILPAEVPQPLRLEKDRDPHLSDVVRKRE